MDIVQTRNRPRAAWARRATAIAAVFVLIAGALWALGGVLHPQTAEPVVSRDSVVIDVVRRGSFARSVRASGRLLSDRVFAVSAAGEGVVTALPVRPGTRVERGSIVAVLSNPDLEAALISSQAELRAAQAEVASVREQARVSDLDLLAARTAAVAQAGEDADAAASARQLHAQGYIADLVARQAAIKASASHDLVAIAVEKVAVGGAQAHAKLVEAQARAEQLAARVAADRDRLATLTVRAAAAGIVQSVAVETGARLSSGASIAQVADGADLKAQLDVPETMAHTVAVGMPASIDVQNQSLAGHVARIDPAAQNGSVAVDVTPDRAFPAGARPQGSVDGSIRLSSPKVALSIARPVAAVDGQTLEVYRIDDGGTRARRTRVSFGLGSDDRVTIVSGLEAGQSVIISDMSAANGAPVVRLQ